MGRSKIAADPRDRRFSHVVWQKSGYYKRLMQGFVAWRDMLNRVLDRADTTTEDRERARFVLQLFTETFAPTNSLLGNPGALQRITETRGKSLLYGMQNFIDDLTNNFGMPRQVDERKFQVGKNLAITPGAVVFRGEAFELIQYTPQTDLVHKRPLVIVPPQINKFYATDLSPGRSFAEYAVQPGHPDFLHQLAQSDRRATRLEHGDLSLGVQAGHRRRLRHHRRGSASTPWRHAPVASRWRRCSDTWPRRATRKSRAPRCW